jgi:DNA-binding CsgD family transcriptional regulator
VRSGKGVTADKGHPVDRLTAREITTLRHVLDHRTAKEIARIEGVSEDAIVNRINRARAKLGGVSRVEAARIVGASMGDAAAPIADHGTSHQMVSQPMGVASAAVVPQTDLANPVNELARNSSSFPWPFPTANRPRNDDSLTARIAWPIILAFLTVLALVMLNTVLQSLNNVRL